MSEDNDHHDIAESSETCPYCYMVIDSSPPPKLRIMIMVPNYWGKADTVSEAWSNVKKECGKSLRDLKRGKWRIYVVWDTEDVKTHIDDMGGICYPSGHHYTMIDEH